MTGARTAGRGGRRVAMMVLCAASLVGRAARGQAEFPQTLRWGSGLIDIPAAWVSPLSGDFSVNWAAKSMQTSPGIAQYQSSVDAAGAFQLSLFRHAEVGLSVLARDFEHGFYGQLLLLNQDDFRGRSGSFLPSLAIGVRNLGPYSHLDRFGLGYQQTLNPGGGSAPIIVADSLHRSFSTSGTVYGVATKSFSLADLHASWPDVGMSLTVGYGNGLFSDHGAVPTRAYAADATGGLFYGVKTDYRPSPNTLFSVMAENNAWDFNVGTYVSYRGLRAGIAITELAAGGVKPLANDPASALYRYTKVNFSIGWESNVIALLRGNLLQNRVVELRRERDQLLADIGHHQEHIVQLQGEIHRYEAQNLLELEERRAVAQTQLQTETDALHRLEERLRRIESETSGAAPASAPPSSFTPPTTPARTAPAASPNSEHAP